MLNDHTSLLKRLKFMDNDIDGLEKETKNIKSDLKKIRMEKN
jgi:predicted  nucleic acid-binding Zn-ribbon protein